MKKIIIKVIIGILLIIVFLIVSLQLYTSYNKTVYDDITSYEKCYKDDIFSQDMKKIWPATIDNNSVEDYYLMTYYADATAYTGYLIMNYGSEQYLRECKRLKEVESTEYLGYFEAEGFDSYELLAIIASNSYKERNDSLGFTYALTDGKSKIIYVELEYPHTARSDYKKLIPNQYLPRGVSMDE